VRRLLLAGGATALLYDLLVRGALTLDLGIGRSTHPLGPVSWTIAAPRERVFDAIRAPYAARPPRALRGKLDVWERGSDLVLAAHRTPAYGLTAVTVETVRFERPERISFRLVRGPVPHVSESFVLEPDGEGTRLTWEGELGTDLWGLGRWWGRRVAGVWEKTVRSSVEDVRAAVER
jgi:hypothetical protein